ncbi:MAG: hypothetical protein ABI647_23540 [Gemmatimonadota bacterium]
MSLSANSEIARLAAACATRLDGVSKADVTDAPNATVLEPEFGALMREVGIVDPALTFDRDGRPSAIAAVRNALPLTERDLLDAIIEDHGCEMAALRAAMFEVIIAAASSRQP